MKDVEWHHSAFQQHSVTRRVTLRRTAYAARSAADFVERTAAQHCSPAALPTRHSGVRCSRFVLCSAQTAFTRFGPAPLLCRIYSSERSYYVT